MFSRFVYLRFSSFDPHRALGTLRVWVAGLYRSIRSEGLDYRATSLAYTTLLSIVPGLALCFSLLKTFGVNRHLEPFLLQMLSPLGEKAQVLTAQILDFVTRINVGVLGFMGLASLVYITVSMLSKIEKAFNHIWRISQSRSLARRAGDYLSVVLLGPVLLFSAIGLTASMPGMTVMRRLVAQEPFGTLFFLAGKLLSLLLIIAAFAFVYLYIPNTRVPWRAALFGGAVGGVAWKLAGFLFAHFVTGSASYHAIYSSLVIVILFMIWLDLSWLILLLGGQAAMYFQHPWYLEGEGRFADLGGKTREALGMGVMWLIAESFAQQQPPRSVDDLAQQLSLPWTTVKETVEWLQTGGLLEETARGNESYVPARDIGSITVGDVLDAMRTGPGDEALDASHHVALPDPVARIMKRIETDIAVNPISQLNLRGLLIEQASPLNPTTGPMNPVAPLP
jgi:membrane protein